MVQWYNHLFIESVIWSGFILQKHCVCFNMGICNAFKQILICQLHVVVILTLLASIFAQKQHLYVLSVFREAMFGLLFPRLVSEFFCENVRKVSIDKNKKKGFWRSSSQAVEKRSCIGRVEDRVDRESFV